MIATAKPKIARSSRIAPKTVMELALLKLKVEIIMAKNALKSVQKDPTAVIYRTILYSHVMTISTLVFVLTGINLVTEIHSKWRSREPSFPNG